MHQTRPNPSLCQIQRLAQRVQEWPLSKGLNIAFTHLVGARQRHAYTEPVVNSAYVVPDYRCRRSWIITACGGSSKAAILGCIVLLPWDL